MPQGSGQAIVPDFGAFTRLEPLGEGAMGVVYRAVDSRSQRVVALKILRAVEGSDATRVDGLSAEEGIRRFFREARLAAGMDHPGIVRVLDVGDGGGRPYIAMELVEGSDLETLLGRPDAPALRRRVEIVRDVARALAHAHGRGVIHRDLKPTNVLVATGGRVCITDFGLGRLHGPGPSSLGTRPGTQLGTPLYMSPEQVRGDVAAMGPATDVWSLGVILYQALTGRLPFDGDTIGEVLTAVATAAPVPPRAIDRFIPPEAEELCLRCLEKEAQRRPASAEAIAGELTALLAGEAGDAAPRSDAVSSSVARAPLVAGQSLGRFRTVLFRPAALFREKVRRSAWFLFLGTAVSTALCVLASRMLFPEAGGLLAVCLLALSLQEELVGILDENRDLIWAKGESPSRTNARLACKFVALVFGMFLGFASMAYLLSEDSARATFSPVLGRFGSRAARMEEIDYGSPGSLLAHNAVVALGCFLFSFLFRSGGALLFLAWNASVWGSVYGFVTRLQPSGKLSYAARVALATAPHMIAETGGYVLVALAGIFVSKAIAKYGFEHAATRRVASASALMFLAGLALVAAGACLEAIGTPALVRLLFQAGA